MGGGGVIRGTLEAESEGGASEWEIKGGGFVEVLRRNVPNKRTPC